MPDESSPRAALAGAACAAMAVFGIVMALLGALLPSLMARLSLDVGRSGTLFLAMNGAMLAASFPVGRWMDARGVRLPLAAGAAAVAAALALFDTAKGYGWLLAASALLGAGGAAVNAGSNTLVALLSAGEKGKASALNLLGVFFGIGALLVPLGLGAAATAAGASLVLRASAGLCAAVALYSLLLAYPRPGWTAAGTGPQWHRLLRSPVLLVAGLMLCLESGNEFTLGGYLSTYLSLGLGLGAAPASFLLASYWAALMLARIALSRWLRRARPVAAVRWASAASAIAVAASLLPVPPWLSAVCLVAAGAALAGIFPTMLGILGSRFEPQAGTVFGMVFAMALCGGILMPFGAAQLAAADLRLALAAPAAAFALITLLTFPFARLLAGSRKAD
jgi:fucose permease